MDVDAEHTISNIAISQAQRAVEQTPSEPFLPPKASGSYRVDQSVIAGMSADLDYPSAVVDSYYSFSYPRNRGRTRH